MLSADVYVRSGLCPPRGIGKTAHAIFGGHFASKAEANQIRTRSEGEANQNFPGKHDYALLKTPIYGGWGLSIHKPQFPHGGYG